MTPQEEKEAVEDVLYDLTFERLTQARDKFKSKFGRKHTDQGFDAELRERLEATRWSGKPLLISQTLALALCLRSTGQGRSGPPQGPFPQYTARSHMFIHVEQRSEEIYREAKRFRRAKALTRKRARLEAAKEAIKNWGTRAKLKNPETLLDQMKPSNRRASLGPAYDFYLRERDEAGLDLKK